MKTKIFTLCITASVLLSASVHAQVPVVTYPNGGEVLTVGQNINITWTGVPNGTIVGIDYTTNNWATTTWLTVSYASTGSYAWTIPNSPSAQCKVGVFRADNFQGDISNGFFTITTTTGVQELPWETLQVYPNPASDLLYINIQSDMKLNFEMYDNTGRSVTADVQKTDQEMYRVFTGGLASGLYILVIYNEDKTSFYKKKVIVQQ
jgi:hypothetical protein